jgi:arylsulfatase A-like enzyme
MGWLASAPRHNTTRNHNLHATPRSRRSRRTRASLAVTPTRDALDDVVGKLLKRRDDLGIANNTIVMFTSNNALRSRLGRTAATRARQKGRHLGRRPEGARLGARRLQARHARERSLQRRIRSARQQSVALDGVNTPTRNRNANVRCPSSWMTAIQSLYTPVRSAAGNGCNPSLSALRG